MDIICSLETYVGSTLQSDNGNLEIPGYNLVCSDHPSNSKCGDFCIYCKALLPFRVTVQSIVALLSHQSLFLPRMHTF